ncbi:alpha/beta hydrolase [soil metagenome]
MTELSHIHRFAPGNRREAAPILLLHGTGGDENDLLPLGEAIAPGATLLSARGKVLEHGMPRFFRRLAEGVFDEADVIQRANDLADFVIAARKRYDLAAPIALGYSNGANIAAAMMLLRPEALAGGILLRAMVPLSVTPKADFTGKPVLIVSGQSDPIIPSSNSAKLADTLAMAGANVEHKVLPLGHQLSSMDVSVAKTWLQGVEAAAVG